MTPQEKEENTKRIIALQDIIPDLAEEEAKLERKVARLQLDFDTCDATVKKLEREAVRAVADRELIASEKGLREKEFREKKTELAKRRAELEELLKPYEDIVAALETEVNDIETKAFNRLMKSMADDGWTEEDCRLAARTFKDSHPKAQELKSKKKTVQDYRECRMSVTRRPSHGISPL